MKKTITETKSQLAKLLATENIEVQENAVQTASFDVKDRILTIPIFKEEQKSKHVYDMLVGHEVSHALHTPSDGWMNMKDRSQEFRSFVNVIEDARIDKLIQKKYPGLTNDYLLGFKKMYKDNFFGTKGKDFSTYALIDKINMYFKSSKTLDFNFSNKEKHFVKLVDNCKSFADVQKLAEDILGYCKEELKKNPKLKKTYTPKKEEGDDKQEGDNQDSQSNNSGDNDSEDQKSDKSAEDKLQDFLSKETGEDKKEDLKQTGSAADGADGDVKIVSITNQNYDKALQNQVDGNASKRSYNLMPGVRLNKLIIPYKEYIKDFAKDDNQLSPNHKDDLRKCKEKANNFLKDSSSVVNYLVKEFEMKKNAQQHARTSISKTGIIDPLKLHSYKFAEDIFKKISSIPNQKNHGMIFLLDWSGSMQRNLMSTTEQLLNLVMFCRKVNIPFSVYKFLNNANSGGDYFERQKRKFVSNPDSPFITNSKTLQPDQSTRLVQLFTHKQSKSDFKRCAENLYRSAMYFDSYGHNSFNDPNYISVPSIKQKYYLSSTPLNESLIAMDTIIAKFRKDYKTDKVALVTLTDGSANSIHSASHEGNIMIKLNNRYKHCQYRYAGEKNRKDMTQHLLEYLKKKYQLQTIGFFLVKKYNELRYNFNIPYSKEALARRMFTKDKFIADYNTGYDVYYYCKSDTKVTNKVYDDTVTINKNQLKRMFMSGMKKRLNSRVLLQNFIKRIA
jgi:hypothetical protein